MEAVRQKKRRMEGREAAHQSVVVLEAVSHQGEVRLETLGLMLSDRLWVQVPEVDHRQEGGHLEAEGVLWSDHLSVQGPEAKEVMWSDHLSAQGPEAEGVVWSDYLWAQGLEVVHHQVEILLTRMVSLEVDHNEALSQEPGLKLR